MRFVLIFLLLHAPSVYSQGFIVYPDLYDSIPSGFSFHLTGDAFLTDSMIVEVELKTADSLHTVLYQGTKNMLTGTSTFPGFTYDVSQHQFNIQLGVFTTRELEIWLRVLIDGVIREELLLAGFDN